MTVDLCDLYAEKFDPVMWPEERRDYHDLARNQSLRFGLRRAACAKPTR